MRLVLLRSYGQPIWPKSLWVQNGMTLQNLYFNRSTAKLQSHETPWTENRNMPDMS